MAVAQREGWEAKAEAQQAEWAALEGKAAMPRGEWGDRPEWGEWVEAAAMRRAHQERRIFVIRDLRGPKSMGYAKRASRHAARMACLARAWGKSRRRPSYAREWQTRIAMAK